MAEQKARAKHKGLGAESITEGVVWPAGASTPWPRGHQQPLCFQPPLLDDSWKCIEQENLLCHTDNPDAWRSDRAPLWNHFPLFVRLLRCIPPCRVIFWCKVRPGADGGCVSKWNYSPFLNLDPAAPPLGPAGLDFFRVLVNRGTPIRQVFKSYTHLVKSELLKRRVHCFQRG